ncbi:hypothetical protein [Rhodohalobacter barkolensis]|uniref:Efflux transporter periplasmic adaptor subunit n=1 Tax=Rhodohalobacter barkolensis TaxID=2053187 RepID=A0A2N0VHR1_9BACT|nr:hypothetical protein [Rhodohalobacter barkolensis]PKD43727.1 hypothetical protein CWD77_09210 [Rhodohalobacter barkolensis]
MKKFITLLALITGLVVAGCASDNEDHSHGSDGDHTHEEPAQQSSTGDSDAVRIGGGADSVDVESDHSHDEDSDHSHEEEHTHDDDSTHSHGDEEHDH